MAIVFAGLIFPAQLCGNDLGEYSTVNKRSKRYPEQISFSKIAGRSTQTASTSDAIPNYECCRINYHLNITSCFLATRIIKYSPMRSIARLWGSILFTPFLMVQFARPSKPKGRPCGECNVHSPNFSSSFLLLRSTSSSLTSSSVGTRHLTPSPASPGNSTQSF